MLIINTGLGLYNRVKPEEPPIARQCILQSHDYSAERRIDMVHDKLGVCNAERQKTCSIRGGRVNKTHPARVL